jgi:predicted aspartyl protease
VIKRPRGTTPIIGVVALEQMGFRVDPTTGKLVKGAASNALNKQMCIVT